MRIPCTFRFLFGTVDAIETLVKRLDERDKKTAKRGKAKPWTKTGAIEKAIACLLEKTTEEKKTAKVRKNSAGIKHKNGSPM